ncbi:MarC family protein [Treponema brennaborense]|uniref:UPF0056 inner membrane protein n=1 Tax=Treponema brennaborense (strain DSM 12168 / CIP 105900 / DD5/3) TaxID=906968 RepID=F4LJL8_TREBD|nr:MarC family protein [Treponema brennaborense]AEE16413.1 multiple antibiotic resistance (MarC)-related protein [Treponema brennaborense DSM 12168]
MFADFIKLLLTVLIIMDPIGIIPQYLSVTALMDESLKRTVIKRAVCIAALVLFVFILLGRYLLLFFGIQPGAFYISGGILFFLIAFEMIYSKPRSRQTPAPVQSENEDPSFVALFPLAIPLIAGPGLITTIMVFSSTSRPWIVSAGLLAAAVCAGLVCVYVSLRGASLLLRFLHHTGMFVVEKIMGLILSGMAVQLIYDGLIKLGIIGGT